MPTVRLSPIFNGWQGFTPGGLPLNGGFVYTYAAGTSTPAATYTTTAGNVANANPIPLGADGRPPSEIWLATGSAYKFVLTGADLVPVGTYDDILGVSDINNLNAAGNTVLGTTGNTLNVASGALSVASGNTTVGGDLAVVGNSTLTGNAIINGNTTIGNASTDSFTIAPATITYSNPVTHTNSHTFSGALAVTGATSLNGNTTLGDSATDIVTLVGTPAGLIVAGSYTPTVTAVANCSAASAQTTQYMRLGDRVMLAGVVLFTITVGATITQLGISLPISSNFAGTGNASGAACTTVQTNNHSAVVYADSTNDRLQLDFVSNTAAAAVFYFTAVYQVI